MKDLKNGLRMAEGFCIYVIGLVIGRSSAAAMSTSDFVGAVVLAGIILVGLYAVRRFR